jgi:uncharacterized membrane protein
MKNPSKEQLEVWHKDPNNWICGGLLYYNKEDERLLPPKRVAWMGWTVNFANPKSIGLLVVVLIAVYVLINFLPNKS